VGGDLIKLVVKSQAISFDRGLKDWGEKLIMHQ